MDISLDFHQSPEFFLSDISSEDIVLQEYLQVQILSGSV